VLWTNVTNLDIDILLLNFSLSIENLIRAKWHRDCNRNNYRVTYSCICYFDVRSSLELFDQGTYKKSNRFQVVGDIWDDLLVLHKLQQKTFDIEIFTIYWDRVNHQVIRYCWKNGFSLIHYGFSLPLVIGFFVSLKSYILGPLLIIAPLYVIILKQMR